MSEPKVKENNHIVEQFELLQNTVGSIEKTGAILQEKIAPLLMPETMTRESPPDETCVEMAPFAHQLAQVNQDIKENMVYFKRMIERIDIK